MDIAKLLTFVVEVKASDLHLSAGLEPRVRIDGDLHKTDFPVLQHKDIIKMIYTMMDERQRRNYEQQWETDFSFELTKLARFRVNVFMQARGVAMACRVIPSKIPSMGELEIPAILADIAAYSKGLVLVTGPTGSGKSTSLAAIIDYINETRQQHILTVEDPIEFVHVAKKCLINQREVRRDTQSFAQALRSALREDPDVILIGELRDLETMRFAMTAAETGHLVLASLHTNSATTTINRIIDLFPSEEKLPVRTMLAESLRAVVAQTLVKKTGGGRVIACEIMLCNAAIRNLLREDKIAQMYSFIQLAQSQGMQTLDQHLSQLVNKNRITRQTARDVAIDKSMF
jgi:twitching motility protein PilT